MPPAGPAPAPGLRLVRTILVIGAVAAFAIGIAILPWRATLAGWLSTGTTALVAAAIAALAFGLVLTVVAIAPRPQAVRVVATVLAGAGIAGWLVLAFGRGDLSSEGRWLVAAVADLALVLGIAAVLSVRRQEASRRVDGVD